MIVDGLQPVRIVKTQHRSLRRHIRGTHAGRMFGIAFDLGGAEFVRFDENRIGYAADRESAVA